MEASLFDSWIAALRSGTYLQGRAVLSKDGRFCCLGVLCEIKKLEKSTLEDSPSVTYSFGGNLRDNAVIPDLYLRKLKFPPSIADILMHMNDNGKTFIEIAQYLEDHRLQITEELP